MVKARDQYSVMPPIKVLFQGAVRLQHHRSERDDRMVTGGVGVQGLARGGVTVPHLHHLRQIP